MRESSIARDVALIAVVHALGCLAVLALGFDHVSDDDFARVTIAQSFAHSPKLDPSGTSWLPLPFWALGTAMVVFGRTLVAARGVTIAMGSVAATLPYLALRMTGVTRGRALLACAFAFLSPWSLWLGAATVPESFTASLTAAAAIALGAKSTETYAGPRAGAWARLGFALAMLAACLSRYEVWPVAAVIAVVLTVRAARERDVDPRTITRSLVVAGIVAVGPLLWIAWNAHAHGDALHFFARVTKFKRALGEETPSTLEALLLHPALFVKMRPDVVIAAAGAMALAWSTNASPTVRAELRSRWLVPISCVVAQLAFLAYGSARDGAPAHHAERALLGSAFLCAAFAADALVLTARTAAEGSRVRVRGAVGIGVAAWLMTTVTELRDVPGSTRGEDRAPQVATGKQLRAEDAAHVEVTPCAYEHFALIAAFGAPERVEARPRTGAPVTTSCPAIVRR